MRSGGRRSLILALTRRLRGKTCHLASVPGVHVPERSRRAQNVCSGGAYIPGGRAEAVGQGLRHTATLKLCDLGAGVDHMPGGCVRLQWIRVGWQEACGGMRAVQGPRGPPRLALHPGWREAVALGAGGAYPAGGASFGLWGVSWCQQSGARTEGDCIDSWNMLPSGPAGSRLLNGDVKGLLLRNVLSSAFLCRLPPPQKQLLSP